MASSANQKLSVTGFDTGEVTSGCLAAVLATPALVYKVRDKLTLLKPPLFMNPPNHLASPT